jgi:hypothetical protein
MLSWSHSECGPPFNLIVLLLSMQTRADTRAGSRDALMSPHRVAVHLWHRSPKSIRIDSGAPHSLAEELQELRAQLKALREEAL